MARTYLFFLDCATGNAEFTAADDVGTLMVTFTGVTDATTLTGANFADHLRITEVEQSKPRLSGVFYAMSIIGKTDRSPALGETLIEVFVAVPVGFWTRHGVHGAAV